MKPITLRIVGYMLISLLLMSYQCVVVVKDKKNRKEEINNAAQSLGEHALWKKIEKTKEVIDETYQKIHALQDSIDQAKYIAHSVIGLGVASIEDEMLELDHFHTNPDAYVATTFNESYGALLKNMYKRKDVAIAAQELADKLYYTNSLPRQKETLDQLVADNNNFRLYFQEFTDKRSLQAASTYRKWADVYRNKGMELSQKVLEDKAFAMTDYERIRTQHLAQRYIVMSYEFIEKSDSLLLAVTQPRHAIRNAQQKQLAQYLFTQKLFEESL